jgi:hypothetical protein
MTEPSLLDKRRKPLKPHCIRCGHFKVDDVSALEAISKPAVHIVEDNVTAPLSAMTLVTAWMP